MLAIISKKETFVGKKEPWVKVSLIRSDGAVISGMVQEKVYSQFSVEEKDVCDPSLIKEFFEQGDVPKVDVEFDERGRLFHIGKES